MASAALEVAKEFAGWIAAGISSTILLYTKTRKVAAKDLKEGNAESATSDVIELLRAEVNRLAVQNAALAKIVGDLQLEVIAVREENGQLRAALQRLGANIDGEQDRKAAN
jgi:FtsZ-binding cell division protein ZapB